MYPKGITDLAEQLSRLPGIGKRTAERLAMAMLDWPETELEDLAEAVRNLPERVKFCECCGSFSDSQTCTICSNPHREARLICVLEYPRQVPGFERAGRFSGRYHVLGGRLSPLDGVTADDLRIQELLDRVAELDDAEVILATSADVEGEATAAYLAKRICNEFSNVRVTRIAQGIPVGADLSYTDAATLAMALESRRTV
jgi:recombination protein RecR